MAQDEDIGRVMVSEPDSFVIKLSSFFWTTLSTRTLKEKWPIRISPQLANSLLMDLTVNNNFKVRVQVNRENNQTKHTKNDHIVMNNN